MRKVKKEVIDVPGVSWHLKKEGIPLNPVIRAGDFVFVSGLTPTSRRTGKIPLVTVEKQTKMVLDNMKVCLEAAEQRLLRRGEPGLPQVLHQGPAGARVLRRRLPPEEVRPPYPPA